MWTLNDLSIMQVHKSASRGRSCNEELVKPVRKRCFRKGVRTGLSTGVLELAEKRNCLNECNRTATATVSAF